MTVNLPKNCIFNIIDFFPSTDTMIYQWNLKMKMGAPQFIKLGSFFFPYHFLLFYSILWWAKCTNMCQKMPSKSTKPWHYSPSWQISVKFCIDLTPYRLFLTPILLAHWYIFTYLCLILVIMQNETGYPLHFEMSLGPYFQN